MACANVGGANPFVYVWCVWCVCMCVCVCLCMFFLFVCVSNSSALKTELILGRLVMYEAITFVYTVYIDYW